MSIDRYLGAISGTSVDGLDLAVISVSNEQLSIEQATTVALPVELKTKLRKLANPSENELDELGFADAQLGNFIGQSIQDFLSINKITDVRAIGSHGQTVRHRPTEAHSFTLQIGDPNRIAEITGITTVADFRRRDMAAGGHGAPLVPPFHHALFVKDGIRRVILNIGGISNVSILSSPPIGFDTGPGNCLMDEWVSKHKALPYDQGGAWAATGNVQKSLLASLLSDHYFQQSPPKSTGREYFHLEWLAQHNPNAFDSADVQATLAELTAQCTIDALADIAYDEIVVCGGGRHNHHLMQRLSSLSGVTVASCDVLGVDGDAIEAAAFAWLAYRTMAGLPGNEPAVTGASDYRVLGAIYPG